MAEEIPIHRGGVLQHPELLETGEIERPNYELVLAFCSYLIKNTHSGDKLWLAAHAAKNEVGATTEEMYTLLKSIDDFKKK